MTEVTLTEWEIALAAHIGVQREIGYRLLCGWEHRDKRPADVGWQTQVEGACGEVAFAKAVGLYWPATVNTFKGVPDVAEYEVRTRSRHDYGLLIRANDPDERAFVLVTGECPTYRVWGWQTAGYVKQHGRLMDPKNDGRPPFYVLDDKAQLRPFTTKSKPSWEN